MKRKHIKWILLALLLVAAVLLASAWRWVPWLEDQRDMSAFFDHVESGTQQRYKPQAALSPEILLDGETEDAEIVHYRSVDLTGEEAEAIWDILVKMGNLEKISQPKEKSEMYEDECIALAGWPEEPYLHFYEDFFVAGSSACAVCDNYSEIYQELRAYLLDMDAGRFQENASFEW